MTDAPKFTIDRVVEIYNQTKADIELLAAAQAKNMEPLAQRLELCKAWLLDHLNKEKIESARTVHGLAYKSTVLSATVDPEGGWDKLLAHILEAVMNRILSAVEEGASEVDALQAGLADPALALLNHAVNKTAVKERLEQDVLVPGVKIARITQVNVRKA